MLYWGKVSRYVKYVNIDNCQTCYILFHTVQQPKYAIDREQYPLGKCILFHTALMLSMSQVYDFMHLCKGCGYDHCIFLGNVLFTWYVYHEHGDSTLLRVMQKITNKSLIASQVINKSQSTVSHDWFFDLHTIGRCKSRTMQRKLLPIATKSKLWHSKWAVCRYSGVQSQQYDTILDVFLKTLLIRCHFLVEMDGIRLRMKNNVVSISRHCVVRKKDRSILRRSSCLLSKIYVAPHLNISLCSRWSATFFFANITMHYTPHT